MKKHLIAGIFVRFTAWWIFFQVKIASPIFLTLMIFFSVTLNTTFTIVFIL